MLEKIKIKVVKFLDKIAKQNNDTYGNKKMDCCKLNKVKKDEKKL